MPAPRASAPPPTLLPQDDEEKKEEKDDERKHLKQQIAQLKIYIDEVIKKKTIKVEEEKPVPKMASLVDALRATSGK